MRRRVIMLLLAILAIAGVSASYAPNAHAASPCDTIVYDGTSRKLLGKTAQLEKSVQRLKTSIKADVHVVLVDSVPGNDIETYVSDLVLSCPGWHNYEVNPDLMVFTYSVTGGKTAGLVDFRTGADYYPALLYSGDAEQVIDEMVDDLRAGTYAAAFQKGISKAGSLVKNYNGHGRYQQKPGDPPVYNNPPSMSGTSSEINWAFWRSVGITAGVLIVLALAVGLFIRENRRRNEALKLINDRHSQATRRLDPLNAYETDLDVDLAEEDIERSVDDKINGALGILDRAFGDARTAASTELTACEKLLPVIGWRARPYIDMSVRLKALLGLVTTAESAQQKYAQYLTSIRMRIASAPSDREELVPEPDRLSALARQRQDEGYKFDDVGAQITELSALLLEAGQEIEGGRPGQSIDEIEEVQRGIAAITAIIERGPIARAQIEERVRVLQSSLKQARSSAQAIRGKVHDISQEYGNRCVASLASNEVIADNLRRASDHIVEGARLGSMDFQRWDESQSELSSAENFIREVNSQIGDITQTEVEMRALRTSLTSEIAQQIREANSERSSMNFRKGSQFSYKSRLDGYITSLEQLAPSRGDLLDVKDEFTSLCEDIVSVVGDSEKEHNRQVTADTLEAQRAAALAQSTSRTTSGNGGFNSPDPGQGASRSL